MFNKIEKFTNNINLEKDFDINNSILFKLSFEESVKRSPLISTFKSIFNPNTYENISRIYLTDLGYDYDDINNNYISKKEYLKKYKTMKGWNNNLSIESADYNFIQRQKEKGFKYIVNKNNKSIMNYISTISGSIIGNSIDPTNFIIGKIFYPTKKFTNNLIYDSFLKGVIGTTIASGITESYPLLESNIRSGDYSFKDYIKNNLYSGIAGGILNPIISSNIFFRNFKADKIIEDNFNKVLKSDKSDSIIKENIRNYLESNNDNDNYNFINLNNEKFVYQSKKNITNNLQNIQNIYKSINEKSKLNTLLKKKHELLNYNKIIYNDNDNRYSDFKKEFYSSDIYNIKKDINICYETLNLEEKKILSNLNDNYNSLYNSMNMIKNRLNDYNFSPFLYNIVKDSNEKNSFVNIKLLNKLSENNLLDNEKINLLHNYYIKKEYDLNFKNINELLDDVSNGLRSNNYIGTNQKFDLLNLKEKINDFDIEINRIEKSKRIKRDHIKSYIEEKFPDLIKYENLIFNQKTSKNFKSRLNDFNSYIKHKLFRDADIVNKSEMLKNKILEYKSDYTLGYRKVIQSTQQKISSLRLSSMSRFYSKISDEGLMNYFKNENNSLNIMKALNSIRKKSDNTFKKILPKESIALAELIHQEQKYQLNYLKNLGVYIEELDDFIIKQTHNKAKLNSIGKDNWIKKISPLLDTKKTFNTNDEKKIKLKLGYVFNKLSKYKYSKIGKFTFRKLLKQKSRVLHFKDIESFQKYNKEFGVDNNIFDAINKSIDSFNRKRAIYETWGLDPYRTKEIIDNFFLKDSRFYDNPYIKEDIMNKNLLSNTKLFDLMMGTDITSMSNSSIKFHESIRSVFRMSRLQGFTASLPDLGTMVIMSKIFDIPVFKSVCHIIKNFIKKQSLKDKNFSIRLGVYCEHINSEIRHTFESSITDSPHKNIVNLNNLFFKLNLQNFWDKITRNSSCTLIATKLNELKFKKFNNLNNYIINSLKEDNINEFDWRCIKYISEGDLIDPFLVYKIPDKLLKKIIVLSSEKFLTENDYRHILKYKLINFYHKNVNLFIPTPNDRTRIFTTGGLPAGTVSGEIWRHMMQFKSYPIVMITDFIENILLFSKPTEKQKRLSKLGIKDVFKYNRNVYTNMASLAIATTLLGYVVLCVSRFSAGKDIPDINLESFIESVKRGGFFGIAGDMFQDYSIYGRFFSKLESPGAQFVDKVASILSSLSSNDIKKTTTTSKKLLTDNIPFKNIPYIKMAYSNEFFDRLNCLLNKNIWRKKYD
jgi:hypothetical protein